MIGIPADIKKALQHLGITTGQTVVQFGSQKRGQVAQGLANLVGSSGQVILVDVLADDLASIQKAAQAQKLNQIKTHLGDFVKLNGSGLAEKTADFVLVIHTAWRHPHHDEVLAEARRILKPGGKILFLDWQKNTVHPIGQAVQGHLDFYEAQRLCLQSGCERVEKIVNNDRHWGFVMLFPA